MEFIYKAKWNFEVLVIEWSIIDFVPQSAINNIILVKSKAIEAITCFCFKQR